MNLQRVMGLVLVFILLDMTSTASQAALVGHWNFENGSLADSTGNFPNLVLLGTGAIVNGELDTFIGGQGGAVTGSVNGGYTGPAITNKTMVSWLTLDGLGETGGSALSLDRETSDQFDGIVFAERQVGRWMNGSSNFSRSNQDFVPGFQETTTGNKILMAITYEYTGANDITVTGYRNGIQIGQSVYAGARSSWATNDAEVFFGIRHGNKSGGGGVINARIDEAWIFNEVLDISEIQALIPEPTSGVLAIFGLIGFVHYLRKRRA